MALGGLLALGADPFDKLFMRPEVSVFLDEPLRVVSFGKKTDGLASARDTPPLFRTQGADPQFPRRRCIGCTDHRPINIIRNLPIFHEGCHLWSSPSDK